MTEPRLRIYTDHENAADSTADVDTTRKHSTGKPETVAVRAGDVFPILADALTSGRTWLNDFTDDEIVIPRDLYEVILAYQNYRRLAA